MKNCIKFVFFSLLLGSLSTNLLFAQTEVIDENSAIGAKSTSKYGADSIKCIMNLSLYREPYKHNNYKDAIIPWRWVFNNCPRSSQNIFIHGARMYMDFIEKEKDDVRKAAFFDTLMMVYDKRIENFGQEGYILGVKGEDYYKYYPDKIEEIYEILKKSINIEGNKSKPSVLVYYFRSIIGMAVDKSLIDKTEIIEGYDNISKIIDFNIKSSANDPAKLSEWENVKGNIESTFEPFATCDDLIAMYEKKFDPNTTDIEFLTKMTNILERKNCVNSDIFYKATGQLHKLQPNAQSAYLMGKLNLEKNNLSDAAKFMEEAANLFTDNADKVKALLILANIQFSQKNYSNSRNTAYQVLKFNPNDGRAYMLIGDLYASSASNCPDDFGGRSVYWVAVDKYIKAKSVDSSVEEDANSRIAKYSRYYPSQQDLFFLNLESGTPFTVNCWINESTTVRSNK